MQVIPKKRIPFLEMLTIGLLPSFLKIAYYRLRGARIGRRVHIGLFSVLICKTLEVGSGSNIGAAAVLRGKTVILKRHVQIGAMTFLDVERIFIDDDTKINEQVFAGGPMFPDSELKIGKNCIVMQYSFLNTSKPITIGDGSGIGGQSLLFTHGSWQSELNGYPVKFAPITIGKNVWLPWRVLVLPGISIGNGATVGAGSVVTRDIPSASLVSGMSAQIIATSEHYPKRLSSDETRSRLGNILIEFVRYLEYRGLQVESQNSNALLLLNVFGREVSTITCFLEIAVDPKTLSLGAGGTVLSLYGFTSDPTPDLPGMWIDIANEKRTGSSEIGEELVLFLSRYGLRFYRTD